MSAQRHRGPDSPPASYCLAVCLCGGHPDYQPMRPTTSAPTTAPDTRQASSWAEREEPTWLDR